MHACVRSLYDVEIETYFVFMHGGDTRFLLHFLHFDIIYIVTNISFLGPIVVCAPCKNGEINSAKSNCVCTSTMVTIEVARLPKLRFFTDSPLRSSCHGHMIMDDPLRNY